MFHQRIHAHAALPAADIHPQYCGCTDCRLARDPIAFSKARRLVRLQAGLLIAALVGLYGFAGANAAPIAVSFGLGQ